MPLLAVEIAVNTDRLDADRRRREVGKDQGQMTRPRNHRMMAIRVALSGAAGMNMNIGDDIQAALTAVFPQCPEMPPIEPDDAGPETMRVQIVLENEVHDMCAAIAAMPQKKGATHPRTASGNSVLEASCARAWNSGIRQTRRVAPAMN